ncbi:hypothetical protein [Clostridium sulfidigenes]
MTVNWVGLIFVQVVKSSYVIMKKSVNVDKKLIGIKKMNTKAKLNGVNE